MRVEAKVGLFVVLGFLFLLGLSTQLSIVRNIGNTGYKVYVNIKDASGLNTQAKVKLNGVEAGEVVGINFDGSEVKLTLFIHEGIKVPKNSTVSLQQESVLGGKMINIEAGDAETFLEPEESIAKSSTLASFEQTSQKIYDAADEFTKLMNAANNVLDEERQVKLKSTIDDLAVAMRDIKDIVAENKSLINETIKKYKILAEEFILTGKEINQWLPGFENKANNLVAEYTKAGESLNELIGDNAEPLNKAIKSSEEFFSTGKSALVKVDRYLASLTESELQVSIHAQHMASDGYNKSFFALSYLPEPGTYYILKIVTGDDYSQRDASGNLIRPNLHDEGFMRFTAQYGKRFKSILARAGIQESTGGVGIDYFMNKDRLQWTLDIFDFNAENDIRSKSAHLNVGLRYEIFKHVNIYAGVENALNSESQNVYMGLGMQFVDDHLKYFISGTGAP